MLRNPNNKPKYYMLPWSEAVFLPIADCSLSLSLSLSLSPRYSAVSLYAVAVLGTTGPGAESSAGPLFENFLLTEIVLQVLFR